MSDQHPMQANRGAVILCDHLDQMLGGKWLIVGTYTNLVAHQQTHHFVQGLCIYLRFQVEQAGAHEVSVKIIARDRPPTDPPVITTTFRAEVSDVHRPVEIGTRTPSFAVHCPVDPATLPVGHSIPAHFTIWAEVGGSTLASTPLTILFTRPPAPAG